MARHAVTALLATAAACSTASSAETRRIVLSNDDGLTSNVKALYDALKERGHDVIVSVPCQGQSGMGGAIKVGPIARLDADCLHGAARAGQSGAGPMTRAGLSPDFHYVNGTPVMAVLYGIDVLAMARWGRLPDLVLSGPNVGQNVGPIIASSGTVNIVRYALARRIPAVAVSAGLDTAGDGSLADARSTAIATRTLQLIDLLDRDAATAEEELLPAGTGLNVNFPDRLAPARWRVTQIGTFDPYDLRFRGGSSAHGASDEPSRITLARSSAKPTRAEQDDEGVVVATDITVSPLGSGGGDQQPISGRLRRLLGNLPR